MLKKKRAQVELCQEGGRSGSGPQQAGIMVHILGREMNPGTLDTQPDAEMGESSKSTHTSTSNPADKRAREVDEEGRASKAIRTYSSQKEKNRRTHGESKGEITKTLLLNRPVINDANKMVEYIDSFEWGR